MRGLVVAGWLAMGTGLCATLVAQVPGEFERRLKPKTYISYTAEPQSVVAGAPGVLELHFRVADGYHVNSHAPKSELLIATSLTVEPVAGVRAGKVDYPAGVAYSFPGQPGEVLDVYSGDFSVRVPVEAKAGEHTVTGVLRYQACDHAACYPPKSLPVEVLFTAK